jgi:hypothetical protein
MQQQQANGCSVALTAYRKSSANLKAVWPGIFGSVFDRFSAKLGPKAPLDRRGSSCSAGCTKNQPGRPILKPFRGAKKKATRLHSSTQATTTHKPTDCPLNKPSGTLLKGPNRLLPGLRPQGPTNESQRPAETEQKSFGWQAKVTGRFCPSERTSQPRHPSGRHTARATSCA